MRFIIEKGPPLRGEAKVAPAKNAALPILAAALLTKEELFVEDLPGISDIAAMLEILGLFGVRLGREGRAACLCAENPRQPKERAYAPVRQMRASILVLGPLLARLGEAFLPLPGGCAIGSRPVDLHVKGLEALGADIEYEEGGLRCRAAGLRGATVYLDSPSVGATENILMAATLARGSTLIQNAAREPEIVDLARVLSAMGARISGAGTSFIAVEGVESLHGARVTPMPDRIEAGTLLLCAAATRGEILLRGAAPEHLFALNAKLLECGCELRISGDQIYVRGGPRRGVDVQTQVYPGFPTDLQAPMMALLCRAKGSSILVESIFENRFMHAAELRRMGAQITVRDRIAVVRGVKKLYGTELLCTDLRAGAALVLAALDAEGQSRIGGVEHIDRGYENLEQKLGALGARIRREE
ncbi:MAG: UDP-N-acetylglucosamine 1-carboxyvinyltransferase [Christensenellaceae bacterium]|jgi:UDP-N-acetylglucosamine 1-carboxyvinyltransferase|nr:UDP-N-acetylglucosamine 1-carboxyvinyltransferase [Christensenellaceae bacterium]